MQIAQIDCGQSGRLEELARKAHANTRQFVRVEDYGVQKGGVERRQTIHGQVVRFEQAKKRVHLRREKQVEIYVYLGEFQRRNEVKYLLRDHMTSHETLIEVQFEHAELGK